MRTIYEKLILKLEHYLRIDARYFLRGGFWLSLGQVTNIILGLVTTALLAQYLTENDYGVYKYLLGIIAILSSFSLTGLGQSVLQTAAKKYYGFYRETLLINFKYSLFVSLISVIATIYYWINSNITLAIGCLLIAILQPLISTYQFAPAHLQGTGRFKESTILNTGRVFFSSIVTLVTLYFTKSIILLFSTYLLGQFILNIFSHFLFSPSYNKTPKDVFDKYIKYAKHTSIRNAISNIAQRVDAIIIFTQLGAVQLAIYSISIVVPEQIKGSFKNLSALLLPKYAKYDDIEVFKKSVLRRSIQLFTVLLIITFTYIFFAPFLYHAVFYKYPEAVFYSQLYALSFPSFTALIPITMIQSRLDKKTLYTINILEATVGVGLMCLLTLHFGITGTIIARISMRYITAFYSYFKLLTQ